MFDLIIIGSGPAGLTASIYASRYKMNNLVEMVREKTNMNLLEIYGQYVNDDFSAQEVEESVEHKKRIRQSLGEVNLTAIREHEALKERHDFIKNQREDLINSIESLQKAIRKINRTSLERFQSTFQEVDQKLKEICREVRKAKPIKAG